MNDIMYKQTQQFLDDLLFMIGDSAERPTEDELMNIIIGFQTSLKYKKLQLEQNTATD